LPSLGWSCRSCGTYCKGGREKAVRLFSTFKPFFRIDFFFALSSVGLGSDFDGMEETPEGLEDVSKYPALVCKGWNLPMYQ
jgi:hypothetical protein